MAKKQPVVQDDGNVKARVLIDCNIGKNGDVIELNAAQAEFFVADGSVDTDPDAVAYAESLKG